MCQPMPAGPSRAAVTVGVQAAVGCWPDAPGGSTFDLCVRLEGVVAAVVEVVERRFEGAD